MFNYAKIKTLGKIFYFSVIIFLLVIGGLAVFSSLEVKGGLKVFSVLTGSMAPAIKAGNMVVVKPFSEYKKGDVVTFKSEADRLVKKPKITSTHRIVEVSEESGKTLFKTKGDFNPAADVKRIDSGLILGKVIFQIPLVGFVLSFSKTPTGFILLVIIPALIIIASELFNIKEQVRLMAVKKSEPKK